ncbi:MAG: endonuclease domain-containing protein [Prevotella sp.]|nr:endonuclease domain-containing protein [Prevotella sp.]
MGYEFQTADPTLYPILKEHAHYNRNHPTEAESLLWNYLNSKRLGVTFKRQHIIGDYIADFVCLSSKLIVELDGGYHQLPQQQRSDESRTEWLESKGYKVLRFTNEELFLGIEKVLNEIQEHLIG